MIVGHTSAVDGGTVWVSQLVVVMTEYEVVHVDLGQETEVVTFQVFVV